MPKSTFLAVWVAMATAFPGAVAAAEARPALVVSRSDDATDCPDAAALAKAIAASNGTARVDLDAGDSAATVFTVAFTRSPSGFVADIRARGDLNGERRVEDVADSCGGLLEATAVTVSLLCDELARESQPQPPPPSPARRQAVFPSDSGLTHTRPTPSIFSLYAAGGALGGVIRSVAPEIGISGAWAWSPRWALRIETYFVPTQDVPIAPGSVRVTFGLASIPLCISPLLGARGLAVCAGPALGFVEASAEDFTSNGSAGRLWAAFEATASWTGQLVGPLGWSVAVGPLIPIKPQAFSIDGVPNGIPIYNPPAVAWLAQAGLVFSKFDGRP